MKARKNRPPDPDENQVEIYQDEAVETAPPLGSRLALRPREAAAALAISARALWALTSDQTSAIPHFRIGRSLLYPVDELRVWAAEQARQNGKGRRG